MPDPVNSADPAQRTSAPAPLELAPDAEKLRAFAATLRAVPLPELSTHNAPAASHLHSKLHVLIDWIETKAANL